MSNNQQNPYATPSSDVDSGLINRSALPKVIGIISIVLSVIGLIGAIGGIAATYFMPQVQEAQASMGFDKNYLLAMNVLGIITSFWALFIGIKLIKYKDAGRRQFNYYTIFAVIMSIVNFFYTKDITKNLYANMDPKVANTAMEMSTMTSLSAFIAPILIIIVAILLNQKRVKKSLS